MISNNVKIIVAAICILVAGCVFYFTMSKDSGGLTSADTIIWFKCVTPDCNAAYSLTGPEFAKLQVNQPKGHIAMPGQQAYKCQKCSQPSAYMAQQCNKCKAVFIENVEMAGTGRADEFFDRCPKCGFSKTEEMQNTQK